MAKLQRFYKELENILLNSDAVVRPIGTTFTGFVGNAQRHKVLKFERDRRAGG